MTTDNTIFACSKENADHAYVFPWQNVAHLLSERARQTPDKSAIVYRDLDAGERSEITYAELYRRTGEIALRLRSDFGIGPGDRVAMALPNCPEIQLLTLALFRLGATSVPLDLTKDVPERKRYKIEDSGARFLCVRPDFPKEEADLLSGVRIVSTDDLMDPGNGTPANEVDAEPDWAQDEATRQHANIILYTSGTTGQPKGVLLTRQSIVSNADGIIRWLGFTENERLALMLPFHHVNSTVFAVTMLMVGGTMVLKSRYSVSNFWPVMESERATAASVVPTIMRDLLARVDEFPPENYDLSNLKKIMIGSAPVPAGAACRFYDRFGIRLVQGYGTTEVSLRVTGVPPDLPDEEYREVLAQNAAGVELGNNNISIHGSPEEGELGEIRVRGPVVSGGYLNQPEATADVFRDGWFYTGDIGFWREISGRRYYFVHGRKKEILIKGGVNISPIAVENALVESFPEIASAYVIGRDHERWGEDICAVVIFKESVSVSEHKAIAERILQAGSDGGIRNLSAYESPSEVIPFQAGGLPMTSTGKVQRGALRTLVNNGIRPSIS